MAYNSNVVRSGGSGDSIAHAEYPNFAGLPVTGVTGTIYITIDNDKLYRWTGSQYTEVSESVGAGASTTDGLPEGATNKYYTDVRADSRINSNATVTSALQSTSSVTDLSDVTDAGSGAIITVAERSAISTNSSKVSADGSVTSHNDVTDAGSGAIITAAERAAIGTGGATELNDLTDVDLTTPATDEQILAYNNSTGKFEPADQATSGPADTDGLSEGVVNKYFTEQRVYDNVLVANALQPEAPSTEIKHVQETPANWVAADGSTVKVSLDEMASRVVTVEGSINNLTEETKVILLDNTNTNTSVTGLNFLYGETRSYRIDLVVERGILNESFIIKGVQNELSWVQTVEKIGDNTGVSFSVNSEGQLEYTTTSTGEDCNVVYKTSTISSYDPSISISWSSDGAGTYSSNKGVITKTSGDAWDSSTRTIENIIAPQTNTSIEFTLPTGAVGTSLKDFILGYQQGAAVNDNGNGTFQTKLDNIQFGLFIGDSNAAADLYVVESGNSFVVATVADLDVLKISIDNLGVVTYFQNGGLVHTSANNALSSFPMGIGTALYGSGSEAINIKLKG